MDRGKVRVAVVGALALVVVSACTGTSVPGSDGPAGSIASGADPAKPARMLGTADGRPIPVRTSPPSTARPIVTTPQGGPAVVEFSAPTAYSCMQGGNRGEAQVTIGWSVPSATEVILTLDGVTLASGIRDTLPYQVLAGAASEVGSTVVFACDPIREHTITISWRMNGAPTTERVVAVTKEPTS